MFLYKVPTREFPPRSKRVGSLQSTREDFFCAKAKIQRQYLLAKVLVPLIALESESVKVSAKVKNLGIAKYHIGFSEPKAEILRQGLHDKVLVPLIALEVKCVKDSAESKIWVLQGTT